MIDMMRYMMGNNFNLGWGVTMMFFMGIFSILLLILMILAIIWLLQQIKKSDH